MTTTQITFEETGLFEGQLVPSIIKDGITVRFLTRVAILHPDVTTQSSPNALMNAGQDINDETGFQKPIIFEFSHLQRRVRVSVGLNERDISRLGSPDDQITAHLVAYDSSGVEVSSASHGLGLGPTSINIPLEVIVSGGDLIQRIMLEYNGNVREVIDNLEFESSASSPIPPDNVAPMVAILQPTLGQIVNSRTVLVTGRITEFNGVTLVINGSSLPVQRIDANTYFFSGEVTLPENTNIIEAIATDEAGHTGADSRAVDIRIPARFSVSEVHFTQTGFFDLITPIPLRRVAGKTSLFRLVLEIRTPDGLQTSVDSANIVIEGGPILQFSPGQPRPSTGNQFLWSGFDAILDGQQVYFFINGRWLDAGSRYRFVLRLAIRQQIVFEYILVSDCVFQRIRGITMLIVPQHRPLDASLTSTLLRVLDDTARMFAVPDGIADLTSDEAGGIRFAILPPASYRNHTDPADNSLLGRSVAYDQGFLLHDHNVGSGPGTDNMYGTADDPSTLWAGEFLPINFTAPEDENRNNTFDEEELARVRGGDASQVKLRMCNWNVFVRQCAESLRQSWNREPRYDAPSHMARRAVAVLTASYNQPIRTGQERTGWAGNAGSGETSYWASLDTDGNGFIPHETGHTFGFRHAEVPTRPCQFSGEAINLLTRQIINPAYSVMCPALEGGSSILFLNPTEYDMLYDRVVASGGLG
jgi:hypothetical protein